MLPSRRVKAASAQIMPAFGAKADITTAAEAALQEIIAGPHFWS
jgi:hypothetical protein